MAWSDMSDIEHNGREMVLRLSREDASALERACKRTGQSVDDVMRSALRAYWERLPEEAALEIFKRHGVIGAVSGPLDLSVTYKNHLWA